MITVQISVEIGETATDDRAHPVTLVQLGSVETVIPPNTDGGHDDLLTMVLAVIERSGSTAVDEARRQIGQILEALG